MKQRKYNKLFEKLKNDAIEVSNLLDSKLTRDIQIKINKEKKPNIIKECFHYDKLNCSNEIIKAHSIQRNGRLSLLENEMKEGKRVYTLSEMLMVNEKSLANNPTIGKAAASIFFGFCKKHDQLLFESIEDENRPFDENDEALFLHSYRAYAFTYHKMKELYSDPDNSLLQMAKESRGIEGYIDAKKYYEQRLNVYTNIKDEINYKLHVKEYNFFRYFIYYKEGIVPVACSGAVKPSHTYLGHPISISQFREINLRPLLLTVLPDQTESFVIIAAFPYDQGGMMLLDELERLSDHQVEQAISSLMLYANGNIFFSPKYWDSLGSHNRRMLIEDNYTLNMHQQVVKNFFRNRINFFEDKYLI